jgi:hypothetical protein
MGAIALHGMHMPLPKSKSFGRGLWTTSFGNRLSKDWGKEGRNKMKRINKGNEMNVKMRKEFFLLSISNHFLPKKLKRPSRGLKNGSH